MLKIKKVKIIYLSFSLIIIFCCFLVLHFMIIDKPEPELEITISDAKFQAFGLIYIALQNGYFNDQNLKVNFRTFNLGKDALSDTVAGNSDLATVFESPYINMVNNGEDISIISSLHKSKSNTAIIAYKENGIKSVSDLKDKKIGVVKGTNSEFLLYTLLLGNNLKPSDIKIVYTDKDSIEQLFIDKKVDAVSVFNPNLYSLEQKFTAKEINIFYSPTYIENSVLAGKTEIIKSKRESITRFLKALAKAEDFYKKNPEKSIDAVSVSIPDVPKETIANLWNSYDLTLSLDNVLLEILKREAQTEKDLENSKTEIKNFRNYIFTDYLKNVKPEDVTIF